MRAMELPRMQVALAGLAAKVLVLGWEAPAVRAALAELEAPGQRVESPRNSDLNSRWAKRMLLHKPPATFWKRDE